MVQEQWQQLEMKFFIVFWHENCYLDGKINLRQGSLPGEGGLEFFKVGVWVGEGRMSKFLAHF